MKTQTHSQSISTPNNLPLIHVIGFHLAKACAELFGQDGAQYRIIHPLGHEQLQGWIEDTYWTCAMLRTHSDERIGLTVYPIDCEFGRHAHYWVNTPEEAVEKYDLYVEHHG
jgi:hypothetical protein